MSNTDSLNLSSKALLITLTISLWSGRKYDRKVSDEIAAQHQATQAGRFNKALVANEAIKEVEKVANEARNFHYTQTLPWGDDGYRILPSSNYLEYCSGVSKLKGKFEQAVNKFITNYDGLKDEARLRLNTLFSELDYPDRTDIARRYNFTTSILPLSSASDFRVNLVESEVTKIQEDIERRMQEAQERAMKDLYLRLKDCLDKMAERLSEPTAIFRDSLIFNMVDLCSLLPRLNMTGDENLEQMRRDIEAKLLKHNPDTLRVDQGARKEVADGAKELLSKMEFYFN